MKKKEIQKVCDLALEKWKSRHYSAYEPEHQFVLSSILAFCDVYFQTTGQKIDFVLDELPEYSSVDDY